MVKYIFLFVLIFTGFDSFAQLYNKPVYPKNYFRWPVELKPDIVANMGELRSNHWHMGLDIRTNQVVNQRVVAAADGYISFVGIKPLSFGRWIVITHPNGLSTLYAHLNNFEPRLEAYVTQQQYNLQSWSVELEIPAGLFPVRKGDFISYSGTTGGSQGPHVHWEVIDTKSDRRLNPTLFMNHIADNIPPTVVRMAMYDRANSTFDQSPELIRLIKTGTNYTVPEGILNTSLQNLSFAIQAYDLRNGTKNQDGIYSARLFFDGREISSFYIDSISYEDTRYMNCQVDYKMKANGGAWAQHIQKLPGDKGSVYYDLGSRAIINLSDTAEHDVSIIVADADGNNSPINFKLKNNGSGPPVERSYEWAPNQLNRIFKYDFEAYLPIYTLYDKMNSGYSRRTSTAANSVSGIHKLGENYLPAHTNFEVRIKPDKAIANDQKNKVVIKRTSKNTTVKKAEWNGGWMTARFRDFGSFEAFVDNVPPAIPSIGSGEVVNLSKAGRISITPTDNFGIADFRAEVNGKWLRFTNDKGRTWIYNFDERVPPGIHSLVVTVTDIAGNKTTRSWKFSRGVTYTPPPVEKSNGQEGEADEEMAETKPTVKPKPSTTTRAAVKTAAGTKKPSATKNKKEPAKAIAAKKEPLKKAATKNKTKAASNKEVAKKQSGTKKTVAKAADAKKKSDTKATATPKKKESLKKAATTIKKK